MNRLVCVVEGYGEVQALPNLCARILIHLNADEWFVDNNPIRRDRGHLVDQGCGGPRRVCKPLGIEKAIELAKLRPANGVIVIVDSDDDCAAAWGPDAQRCIRAKMPGGAVMVVREFESWLLWGFAEGERRRIGVTNPESVRDAKKALGRLVKGYLPTAHQLELTRRISIPQLRGQSRSFDKLVRVLEDLCC